MDTSKERYEELAEKWLNGTISPGEKEEFVQWYNAFPDTPLNIPASFAASEAEHRSRLLAKITSPRRKRWLLPAAAACILLAGSASLFVFQKTDFFTHSKLAAASVKAGVSQKKVILPGGEKAILTLADGSRVALEGASVKNEGVSGEKMMEQQGVMITRPDMGLLRYSGKEDATVQKGALIFNTLTTPRGGVFQIQLSDGTHVWLNSATSLRYPTVFSGTTREVFLSGQAYFEVAKNVRRPFIVHSEKVNVKVLGTAFDMMTYEDESYVRTTLTQGAVSVTSGHTSVVIRPGQQASLLNGGMQFNGDIQFKLSEPDLDEVLAWKEGRFRFSNTNIQAVMRQIARWYDVAIEYQGDVSGLNLTGSVSRKESVEELLKAFEKTGGVHFGIADNRIIVMPH